MREAEKAFTGMVPMVEPHLLPAGASQELVNGNPLGGALVPRGQPRWPTWQSRARSWRSIVSAGAWTTMPASGSTGCTTPTRRGAIPDDAQERTYFTEAGQPPRVTDSTMATSSAQMPTAWYRLGIPAATVRATVTVTPQPNPRRTWSASPASWLTPLCRPGARRAAEPGERPIQCGHERHAQRYQHGRAAGREYNITHKRLYISTTDATGTAILRY